MFKITRAYLSIFHTFFTASIVDFEQVNVIWVLPSHIKEMIDEEK